MVGYKIIHCLRNLLRLIIDPIIPNSSVSKCTLLHKYYIGEMGAPALFSSKG